MTPTEASVPSSLYSPSSSEPMASVTGLVHAVPGDHAVRGPLVLDLEHDALVRLVGDRQRLGDDPVEAGALELVEPSLRDAGVGGRRREVDRPDPNSASASTRAARRSLNGTAGVVVIAEREQVERDERGRRLLGEHAHPRIGRDESAAAGPRSPSRCRWR